MPDQITDCTQRNDDSGNPAYYTFSYIFDGGNGQTTSQQIVINAQSLDSLTDIAAATARANEIAAGLKATWLASLNAPAPVVVSSVIGDVTL